MTTFLLIASKYGNYTRSLTQKIGAEKGKPLRLGLTWQGYKFLDAIRNDTVWQKTKKSFFSQGISMTFNHVKSIASDVAASYLKTTIGG